MVLVGSRWDWWNDEALPHNVERKALIRKAETLGRLPTAEEVKNDPEMPELDQYLYRYGTFRRALEEILPKLSDAVDKTLPLENRPEGTDLPVHLSTHKQLKSYHTSMNKRQSRVVDTTESGLRPKSKRNEHNVKQEGTKMNIENEIDSIRVV